ncbi:hypothetical protein 40AC_75 [Mycobacterium phage 40AC]|uniref:Uncharacterized protein n=1 Tax=Mycobacterium phage 40AC TaxID=1458717 RepID=W8EAM6_9CAUD|nr:hypothetical protein ST40AC_75 [Mycobacterium phage 40AC]AHJ86438.1 hypothetical protein 40AC_75 [Mycobacterium phage 40AC]
MFAVGEEVYAKEQDWPARGVVTEVCDDGTVSVEWQTDHLIEEGIDPSELDLWKNETFYQGM